MKLMTLNGITVEVTSEADEVRLLALGYQYVDTQPVKEVNENAPKEKVKKASKA